MPTVTPADQAKKAEKQATADLVTDLLELAKKIKAEGVAYAAIAGADPKKAPDAAQMQDAALKTATRARKAAEQKLARHVTDDKKIQKLQEGVLKYGGTIGSISFIGQKIGLTEDQLKWEMDRIKALVDKQYPGKFVFATYETGGTFGGVFTTAGLGAYKHNQQFIEDAFVTMAYGVYFANQEMIDDAFGLIQTKLGATETVLLRNAMKIPALKRPTTLAVPTPKNGTTDDKDKALVVMRVHAPTDWKAKDKTILVEISDNIYIGRNGEDLSLVANATKYRQKVMDLVMYDHADHGYQLEVAGNQPSTPSITDKDPAKKRLAEYKDIGDGRFTKYINENATTLGLTAPKTVSGTLVEKFVCGIDEHGNVSIKRATVDTATGEVKNEVDPDTKDAKIIAPLLVSMINQGLEKHYKTANEAMNKDAIEYLPKNDPAKGQVQASGNNTLGRQESGKDVAVVPEKQTPPKVDQKPDPNAPPAPAVEDPNKVVHFWNKTHASTALGGAVAKTPKTYTEFFKGGFRALKGIFK